MHISHYFFFLYVGIPKSMNIITFLRNEFKKALQDPGQASNGKMSIEAQEINALNLDLSTNTGTGLAFLIQLQYFPAQIPDGRTEYCCHLSLE